MPKTSDALSLPRHLERYERQIRLPGLGLEGQEKLKQTTVLVSRVGGVGGTAAMSLTRAGIGRLILAHGGTLCAEYLNRMPLAMSTDLGRGCTEVFVERLHAINPEVELVPVAENINDHNVADLVAQADIVVDGAPLFEERYAMNREVVRQHKPMVSGAMYGLEAYVTTILPGRSPCLACIYPQRPEYWTNIKVFPAIGPGPAMVGNWLAMETIKLATGLGRILESEMVYMDLESNDLRRFRLQRDPCCAVCGAGRRATHDTH